MFITSFNKKFLWILIIGSAIANTTNALSHQNAISPHHEDDKNIASLRSPYFDAIFQKIYALINHKKNIFVYSSDYINILYVKQTTVNHQTGAIVDSYSSFEIHPKIIPFYQNNIAITIHAYLQRFIHNMSCSPTCYAMALIYINRFIEKTHRFHINRLTIHRIFLTAMVIAAKYHDGQMLDNNFYARVGLIPIEELNTLEAAFLQIIHGNLAVTPEELASLNLPTIITESKNHTIKNISESTLRAPNPPTEQDLKRLFFESILQYITNLMIPAINTAIDIQTTIQEEGTSFGKNTFWLILTIKDQCTDTEQLFMNQIPEYLYPFYNIADKQNPTYGIPSVTFAAYLQRLFIKMEVPLSFYIVALFYTEKFIKSIEGSTHFNLFTCYRIFLIAIVLATKFYNDKYYNNKTYAQFGGIETAEFSFLELVFLNLIDHRLIVTPEEWTACLTKVQAIIDQKSTAANLVPPQLNGANDYLTNLSYLER